MTRTTIDEMKRRRLEAMSDDERAEFDETYEATRLALEVGERVRDAREAAGLSQRELAARMSTSQAAVARLEGGGTGATLTTLQKVASGEHPIPLGTTELGGSSNRDPTPLGVPIQSLEAHRTPGAVAPTMMSGRAAIPTPVRKVAADRAKNTELNQQLHVLEQTLKG